MDDQLVGRFLKYPQLHPGMGVYFLQVNDSA